MHKAPTHASRLLMTGPYADTLTAMSNYFKYTREGQRWADLWVGGWEGGGRGRQRERSSWREGEVKPEERKKKKHFLANSGLCKICCIAS